MSSSDRSKEKSAAVSEFKSRETDLVQAGGSGGVLSDMAASGESRNNPYTSLPPLPFIDPNQNIYLINIAHRQQRPKYKAPAFRICGGFRDADKLKRHIARSGGEGAYGGANLHAAQAHKKILLCTSMEKQSNPDYVLKKIEEITALHNNMISFHDQEFNENKESHRMGKTGLSGNERARGKMSSRRKLLDKKFKEVVEKGEEVGEISAMAEARNQKVAVVSVINDLTPSVLKGIEDPEPVVIIWGCFENEDKAKHFIFNTAQEKVRNVMLDVYNMYEWVYPTEMDIEQVEEQYRDPTLTKVMKARKSQKSAVMTFEEWCKREGKEAPTLEIDATDEKETKIKKIETLPAEMTVSTRDTEDDSKEKVDMMKKLDEFEEIQGHVENTMYNEFVFKAEDEKEEKKE
jgi:hypothetical protein